MDSRDHYSQTDREPKRRRSDPMGGDDIHGHHPARDDRGTRCAGCLKVGSMGSMWKGQQRARAEGDGGWGW